MSYTNSPLVSYTKISPNQSGTRTHAIDRITPHCVVGQCSVEALGSLFAQASVQASSNYGIGADGRVGIYVPESNRSWCSSSASNDHRAVCIECASDAYHPFAFKDVVYQKLITLCVDICKRNGKNKLIWLGDKDKTLAYTPKSNEMVLTVHRWFEAKSCPGDWLMARMDDLASKVTAQLSGAADTTPEPKTLDVYYPWKVYTNGSTEEPVYKDTDFTEQTGSLNPYEQCYCTGRYGDAYAVLYKIDGTEDRWAVGYVDYDGGVG